MSRTALWQEAGDAPLDAPRLNRIPRLGPALALRGATSDVLSKDTAESMRQRGPCATVHELVGVGRAPTLIAGDQVAVVRTFLDEP